MNNIDADAAKLAAMPLEELERLAAPVMAALRTKREAMSKEERMHRRREYDRRRKETTVPLSMRLDDKESVTAVRGLVKQFVALAKLNGRTVAEEVAAAKSRLPTGKRKAKTVTQRGGVARRPNAPANVSKAVGGVDAK